MPIIEPQAYSIPNSVKVSNVERTTLYAAMQAGELPFVEIGSRHLIRAEALRDWLASKEKRVA